MKHKKDLPHAHHSHHHGVVSEKTIFYLMISFIINMVLSAVEIIAGLFAGSIALIGDALHNTSDAFSILIAVIAFKIGRKKADRYFTYGFKRAEMIGGFVNLILLFIAGLYLMAEGISRFISPQSIDGNVIIWVSVLALLIDAATAKLSHRESDHNTNLRMVFLHNLADALGSVGVIISGLCVVFLDVFWVDGVVALMIATYMIYQSVLSFPRVVRVLMDAAPADLDMDALEQALKQLPHVRGVHHLHVWYLNENDVSLECHLETKNMKAARQAADLLAQKFGITHCNIQIEPAGACKPCCVCQGNHK